MLNSKLEAKALALQLRAKAELLEALDESQIQDLKKKVNEQNETNCSVWYCRFIECVATNYL
jgi:hypothetical protein